MQFKWNCDSDKLVGSSYYKQNVERQTEIASSFKFIAAIDAYCSLLFSLSDFTIDTREIKMKTTENR